MKSPKFLFGAALAVAGTVLLSACTPPASSPVGAIWGSSNESLVIYSNSVSDGRGDWLKQKASEAGFALNIVDLGGGDVMNRLSAEKNNPPGPAPLR